MYRRVLPDDQLSGASPNSFRQWLHFKSLERGYHASNYIKYPKPGASYVAIGGNPPEVQADLEGWAPDLSVLPRSLWKQERPNVRLFLQKNLSSPIIDASDLKTVISRRVLSNTMPPGLTDEEYTKTIPDSEITRNQLVWNKLDASTSGNQAVFDYVLEQTLGFVNEAYAPDVERANGNIATSSLNDPTMSPKVGAPAVATLSDQRPAKPVTFRHCRSIERN